MGANRSYKKEVASGGDFPAVDIKNLVCQVISSNDIESFLVTLMFLTSLQKSKENSKPYYRKFISSS